MLDPDGRVEVVVIGYGNTLRGDDGFGPAVAQRLRSQCSDERVSILSRHLLTVDLVTELERADFCVLIDAATDAPIGELELRHVAPEPVEPATLGHELSAVSLLGLTQLLSGRAPRCVLIATAPVSMELGEYLTEPVSALLDVAVNAIHQQIASYLQGEHG